MFQGDQKGTLGRNTLKLPFLYFKIRSQILFLEYGSTPDVGSSKTIVLEFAMKAIAIDNLRFIPPDKLHESSTLFFAKPTSTKNLQIAANIVSGFKISSVMDKIDEILSD